MPITNFGAATDKGLHRHNNEDSFLSVPEQGLWLVADGMGGHEAGEVASAIVIETVQQQTAAGHSLVDSIRTSHESVLKAVDQGLGAEGMGSTVVALQSNGQAYEIAWVGDSRAYVWTPDQAGGTLKQLSTDHSYVQLLLASGAIGEQEAANHPDKNVITQCIGSQDVNGVQVDTVKGQWREDQWILLCSDGLTDEVSDEAIAQILCEAVSLRDAIDRLIRRALENGGRDNVTVQIVGSPLSHQSGASEWWDRFRAKLPKITGKRHWDEGLYGAALVGFLFLCYWILA